MNEISLAELQPIIGKSSENFAAWFVNESLAYRSDNPNKVMMAFAPLEHLIVPGRDRTEAECLADIFRALGMYSETGTQTNFKSGLAHAIAKFVRDWQKSGWSQPSVTSSVSLMLRTGKLIGCSEIVAIVEEVYPHLPSLFGDEETNWDTLFETISAVATKNDADRIAKMVASHFRDYMAPMAFLALCRADKARFPTWLAMFRPYFSRLHQNAMERRYAYMTAQKFAKWVDVDTAAKQLCLTQLSPNAELEETDNWLLEALVAEPASPWVLTEDQRSGVLRLGWRNDANCQPIEIFVDVEGEASRECDFLAALNAAWCKSVRSQPVQDKSLIQTYGVINEGRQATNLLRAACVGNSLLKVGIGAVQQIKQTIGAIKSRSLRT